MTKICSLKWVASGHQKVFQYLRSNDNNCLVPFLSKDDYQSLWKVKCKAEAPRDLVTIRIWDKKNLFNTLTITISWVGITSFNIVFPIIYSALYKIDGCILDKQLRWFIVYRNISEKEFLLINQRVSHLNADIWHKGSPWIEPILFKNS